MIPEPDWKAALRAQFEEALAGLEEPSAFNRDDADQEEVEDAPDIYTFYEALAALRHEVRQGNRKTAEKSRREVHHVTVITAYLFEVQPPEKLRGANQEEGIPVHGHAQDSAA